MIVEIELGVLFYSQGDEARFFRGLTDNRAVKKVVGIGRGPRRPSVLALSIDARALTKDRLWDIVALLRRYGISPAPFRGLARARKLPWKYLQTGGHKNVYPAPR